MGKMVHLPPTSAAATTGAILCCTSIYCYATRLAAPDRTPSTGIGLRIDSQENISDHARSATFMILPAAMTANQWRKEKPRNDERSCAGRSIAFCNLAHPLEQFGHANDAMRDGINFGLGDILEIGVFPLDQNNEFLPEFAHKAGAHRER